MTAMNTGSNTECVRIKSSIAYNHNMVQGNNFSYKFPALYAAALARFKIYD